jgi:hypothetical protein
MKTKFIISLFFMIGFVCPEQPKPVILQKITEQELLLAKKKARLHLQQNFYKKIGTCCAGTAAIALGGIALWQRKKREKTKDVAIPQAVQVCIPEKNPYKKKGHFVYLVPEKKPIKEQIALCVIPSLLFSFFGVCLEKVDSLANSTWTGFDNNYPLKQAISILIDTSLSLRSFACQNQSQHIVYDKKSAENILLFFRSELVNTLATSEALCEKAKKSKRGSTLATIRACKKTVEIFNNNIENADSFGLQEEFCLQLESAVEKVAMQAKQVFS